jgi:hypothetical protein
MGMFEITGKAGRTREPGDDSRLSEHKEEVQ